MMVPHHNGLIVFILCKEVIVDYHGDAIVGAVTQELLIEYLLKLPELKVVAAIISSLLLLFPSCDHHCVFGTDLLVEAGLG